MKVLRKKLVEFLQAIPDNIDTGMNMPIQAGKDILKRRSPISKSKAIFIEYDVNEEDWLISGEELKKLPELINKTS